jgi:hypothetical protein
MISAVWSERSLRGSGTVSETMRHTPNCDRGQRAQSAYDILGSAFFYNGKPRESMQRRQGTLIQPRMLGATGNHKTGTAKDRAVPGSVCNPRTIGAGFAGDPPKIKDI